MVRKFKNIATCTADASNAMIARGEDRSGRVKAAGVPMPDGSDPDVLDCLKGEGKGYRTRVNAVLRRHVRQKAR